MELKASVCPQVECLQSPQRVQLCLRTVRPGEALVGHIIQQAKEVFRRNTVGPKQ